MKKITRIIFSVFYALIAFVLPRYATVFDVTGMTQVSSPANDVPVDNVGGGGIGSNKSRN